MFKTTCWEASSVEDRVCHVMTKKQLPCGHWVRGECSELIENIVCKEPVEHTLGCRHTVRSVCGDSLEKKIALTCTVSEMVTLPCGHLYRLQCGSKESEKPLDKIYCRYLYQLTDKLWNAIIKCNTFWKQEIGGEGKQVRPQDHGRMRKEFIQKGLHFHVRENLRLWSPVSTPLPRTLHDRSLQTSSWTEQYHSPVWPSLEGGMQPSLRWYYYFLFHFTLITKAVCIFRPRSHWSKEIGGGTVPFPLSSRTGLWSSLFVTLQRMWNQSISRHLQPTLQKPVGLRPQVRDFKLLLLFCFTKW